MSQVNKQEKNATLRFIERGVAETHFNELFVKARKGGVLMPVYALEMSHTPVSCPIFNADVRKKFKEGAARREEVAKRYKVNVLASCVAVLEHWIFYLIEAEARSSVEDYLKETGLAFYNNIRIREVDTIEDATKRWIS